MEILKRIQVPTGDILIVEGSKGPLEFLSIGDYGKEVNLKSNFLPGLNRDLDKVEHKSLLPLEEKWVITISTQYSCHSSCTFCDVPKVKFKARHPQELNATLNDLIQQVLTGIHLHPEVESTKRLNIHYARMGEPSWNPNVLESAKWFYDHLKWGDDGNIKYNIHPVVSTMCPKDNPWLKTFLHTWMRIKNRIYNGNAGLQLSINSTDEEERNKMFRGNASSLLEISRMMEGVVPFGRKITLNFPICGWQIKPEVLLNYFNPEHYIVKLTPMHKTKTALKYGIETTGDYTTYVPYQEIEKQFQDVGYGTLVFIASEEEDLGRITCGNAILSGTMPEERFILNEY